MNLTIQKALAHLQNANYSGYFEEMDKVVPAHLQVEGTEYANFKGIFIAGQAPWNFYKFLSEFSHKLNSLL
jgi:hypothetical protein